MKSIRKNFKIWYKQNGTPKVKLKRIWNQKNRKLTIQASQSNPIKNNPNNDLPLIIPIDLGILFALKKNSSKTIVLKEKNKNLFLIIQSLI